MIKIFAQNKLNWSIRLFLTAIFLSSFTTGTTASALCLDDNEKHIVNQHFYLADCHFSVGPDRFFNDECSATLKEKRSKDCVDVSLANASAFHLPAPIMVPGFAKNIFSYMLPPGPKGVQRQVAASYSPLLSLHPYSLPPANLLRTVVLLI